MAALAGMGLWDATVGLEGPEVPILDGSALPFAEGLEGLGRSIPDPLQLTRRVEVRVGQSRARIEPREAFSVTVAVEFAHPSIGRQSAHWDGTPQHFVNEVAPARTFGFLSEIEELRERGLIAGGSLRNALVFGPDGPLSTPRFPDEPARHKLLDAIGDLALLGRPLKGKVVLERPGHSVMMMLLDEIEKLLG